MPFASDGRRPENVGLPALRLPRRPGKDISRRSHPGPRNSEPYKTHLAYVRSGGSRVVTIGAAIHRRRRWTAAQARLTAPTPFLLTCHVSRTLMSRA